MATSSTTMTSDSRKKMKGRGKSDRNKILDAFKRIAKSEDDFYDLMAGKAFDPKDNFTYKELLNRLAPMPKSTAPYIEFEFDEKAPPHVQASQVLTAIAKGIIPPDLGNLFVSSIQAMLKIQEVTDFEERLKKIEGKVEPAE